LLFTGCAKSLDMSNHQLSRVEPNEGLVIGSILVDAHEVPSPSWTTSLFGRKAAGFTYDFEIVRVTETDPQGEFPYADRYELEVEPGVERTFMARLKAGDYLIKRFHHEGLSAMGGGVGVLFSVGPGMTQYVGRLHLSLPERVTLGAGYTFRVENAHHETVGTVKAVKQVVPQPVVNVPMHARPR
jgi:hypothetical protein